MSRKEAVYGETSQFIPLGSFPPVSAPQVMKNTRRCLDLVHSAGQGEVHLAQNEKKVKGCGSFVPWVPFVDIPGAVSDQDVSSVLSGCT